MISKLRSYEAQIKNASSTFDETFSLMKSVILNFITLDQSRINFVLESRNFLKLNRLILKKSLEEDFLLDPKFRIEYQSLLKIYLFKTNFKFSSLLIKTIYHHLSSYIDLDQKCNLSLIFELLNILTKNSLAVAENHSIKVNSEESSGIYTESRLFQNQSELTVCSYFYTEDLSSDQETVIFRNQAGTFSWTFLVKNNCIFFVI